MKQIAILIPIYNRLALTQEGLEKLYQAIGYYAKAGKNTIGFNVIIIDDGSTDGSSEWIAAHYPKVTILKGDGSLWWSGAINMGAKYAISHLNCNFVLLWNDDVVPAEDYFLQLEDVINNKDFDGAIVGSKIMYKDNPEKIWSVGGYFNRVSGDAGMYAAITNTNPVIECDWQPGMGTLIPTDIIKKHNVWWNQKNFPQYHGDTDFILRYKRLGVRVVTFINLVIYNNTEATGLKSKRNLNELYKGLTSIRSNYNIYRNIMFYTKHGVLPAVYWGMFKKYFFYIGGFIKHSIINKKSNQG